MPTIEFPDIPEYPGVPQLLRPANAAIASVPALSIGLGAAENILISALQQPPKWGIFDQEGNQLGVTANTQSTLQAIGGALLSQLTGSIPAVLSTFEFEYQRETRVSDFPVEGGGFATYNKVQLPATPTVTLLLQGSENDRTVFLEALESAVISTDLYNVVTPEYVYQNYNIERYQYQRRSSQGVTLLMVEVSLIEVRQISSTFTTVTSPILAPQDPNATSQVNNGITQPTAPPQSTLLQLNNQVSGYLSKFFNGGN